MMAYISILYNHLRGGFFSSTNPFFITSFLCYYFAKVYGFSFQTSVFTGFFFPYRLPEADNKPANLPTVLHSLPSPTRGVITTRDAEAAKQQAAQGRKRKRYAFNNLSGQ